MCKEIMITFAKIIYFCFVPSVAEYDTGTDLQTEPQAEQNS